jgi:hypothetical protein
MDGGILALHILPFSAADERESPFFEIIAASPNKFPPIAADFPRDYRIGVDGLLCGLNAGGLGKPQRAYVLVSPSASVESVASSLARGRGHDFLILPQLQAAIIKYSFDALPTDPNECARRLKPMLNRLARSAGLPSSPYFDDVGNYTLKL